MSIDESTSVDLRLTRLTEEVRALTQRVQALEAGHAVARTDTPPTAGLAQTAEQESEALLGWASRSHALQQVAVITFVLVVALVLRTLTDSRAIGQDLGVLFGIAFATLLIAWGSLRLKQRRPHELLAACGGAVFCGVVFEAHRTFQVLTAGSATLLLAADLVVLTLVGLRWRTAAVLAMATLATPLAALATDFPNPPFAAVAGLTLAATVVAYLARRVPNGAWLQFATLATTLFLFLLWTLKMRAAGLKPEGVQPGLDPAWFLPMTAAAATTLAALAAHGTRVAERAAAFDYLLPPVNVLWAFGAASLVAPARGLGAAALVFGVLHGAVAVQRHRARQPGHAAAAVFLLAGALATAMAMPAVLGDSDWAVPVWAAMAMGLAVVAANWGSSALRLAALLLQATVAVLATAGGLYAVPATAMAMPAAGALTVLAYVQYRWQRRRPLPAGSWLLRLDPHHHADIVLLWAAAAAGFGLFRLGLHLGGITDAKAFQCAQSVVVNAGSMLLMLWGLRARNLQMLASAALVALVGGFRVFAVDLVGTSGVPLVASVFSFGVTAAIGSLVLGKVQALRAAARTPPA